MLETWTLSETIDFFFSHNLLVFLVFEKAVALIQSPFFSFQDEKRSSDRNSVYSKDASDARNQPGIDASSLPSSPAPPPRPLSSIASAGT